MLFWATGLVLDFIHRLVCGRQNTTTFRRLDLCNGPNWVGLSCPIHLRTETDPVSETLYYFLSSTYKTMDKVQNKPNSSVAWNWPLMFIYYLRLECHASWRLMSSDSFMLAADFLRGLLLDLKVKAARFSETLVNYRTTRRHIPESVRISGPTISVICGSG
jgi:hypothetical protein